MSYKWIYSKILRRIIKIDVWEVAIRKIESNDYLYLGYKNRRYSLINNTKEYWFADPILYEVDGRTWLFVEAYSREMRKGEIGVFEIIDDKPENYHTVISMDTHMSFPYIFNKNGTIFMIPETGADHSICLYEQKSFLISGN